MKKQDIKDKLKEGYELLVCLDPNKKYDKILLKTWLKKENVNTIFSVYYNHCKEFLTTDQIRLIDLYNEVKYYTFRDKVELNIAKQRNSASRSQIEKMVLLQAIHKIEYLELK